MHSQTAGLSKLRYSGTGPGEQTLDGCSVEFYKRLPVAEEPKIIAESFPPPATLLELGCGVGRLADPLSESGYEVTAVDNSEHMIRCVSKATAVLSDIESLDLPGKFDIVLLASRLLNCPDEAIRAAFLQTARKHLARDGVLLAEVHSEDILGRRTGDHSEGEYYSATILKSEIEVARASITIEYQIGSDKWTQSFKTEYLTQHRLEIEMMSCGLRFSMWLDDRKTWIVGKPI